MSEIRFESAGVLGTGFVAGLFLTNVGHGRTELAEAAYEQANTLHFFPVWTFLHPSAVQLAAKLASLAPGDLNRVFFSTGGGVITLLDGAAFTAGDNASITFANAATAQGDAQAYQRLLLSTQMASCKQMMMLTMPCRRGCRRCLRGRR